MKGAIETAIGIIMLTFMSVLGASYITVSLNTQRAQNYHSTVINELENSDCSDEVIIKIKEKAAENGYESLAIEKKHIASSNETYAKVTLAYDYSIPILGIHWDNEIVGYTK